jgi:hypothetical protein
MGIIINKKMTGERLNELFIEEMAKETKKIVNYLSKSLETIASSPKGDDLFGLVRDNIYYYKYILFNIIYASENISNIKHDLEHRKLVSLRAGEEYEINFNVKMIMKVHIEGSAIVVYNGNLEDFNLGKILNKNEKLILTYVNSFRNRIIRNYKESMLVIDGFYSLMGKQEEEKEEENESSKEVGKDRVSV